MGMKPGMMITNEQTSIFVLKKYVDIPFGVKYTPSVVSAGR